jgi:hypothetical protein
MTHPKIQKSVAAAILLSALFLQPNAFANSATYTISVTIPAIIGLNVHPDQSAEPLVSESAVSSFWDVNMEKIMRGDETLLVKSITEK